MSTNKQRLLTADERLEIANYLVSEMNSKFKVKQFSEFGSYIKEFPQNLFKPANDYMGSQH